MNIEINMADNVTCENVVTDQFEFKTQLDQDQAKIRQPAITALAVRKQTSSELPVDRDNSRTTAALPPISRKPPAVSPRAPATVTFSWARSRHQSRNMWHLSNALLQDVAKWPDIGFNLMPIHRLGNQHAADKRAQRQRKSRPHVPLA